MLLVVSVLFVSVLAAAAVLRRRAGELPSAGLAHPEIRHTHHVAIHR